jgi:hypothetical protein
MRLQDMQLLSYGLGVALLIVAVIGVVMSLATVKPGRTFEASLNDSEREY